MSYILQALKKSEQEREQLSSSKEGTVKPSSSSVENAGMASVDGRQNEAIQSVVNWRLMILATLSLLLIIAMGYFNQNPETETTIERKVAVSPVEQVKLNKEIKRSEILIDELNTSVVDKQSNSPAKAVIIENQPQVIRPTIAVEQASKSIQSLIPTLDISSHIYSSLAARRSIVVNGERLVEGDFISPQVQVKEITHQGMIIAVNDRSLIVSRSRGWSR